MGVTRQQHARKLYFRERDMAPTARTGTHRTYRKLDAPQGLCEWVGNISPPPEFEHLTAKPLPSHYTDYANPVHY
jgi:hypothetical protein